MLYAVRCVLADMPTTPQVAGVVNKRLIAPASATVLTDRSFADPPAFQPPVSQGQVPGIRHINAAWDDSACPTMIISDAARSH